MKFIKSCIKIIDSSNELIGKTASWLTFLLVIVVSYDVIVRYLFNSSSVALQELEWHIFAIIFLLAAGYTLKIDDHVRVDVFYTRFSPKQKAWINLIGSLFFLIPFCVIIILSTENFVSISFKVKEISPDAGGLPARYILKAIIPISFFLLLLQGVSVVFKSFMLLKDKDAMKGSEY